MITQILAEKRQQAAQHHYCQLWRLVGALRTVRALPTRMAYLLVAWRLYRWVMADVGLNDDNEMTDGAPPSLPPSLSH